MGNSRHASRLALQWSLENLGKLGRVRVWTFTLPSPGREWAPVSAKWHALLRRLGRRKFDMRGVRITEWHPGGHGWHIHWATLGWLPVQSVRAQATVTGFGRVHVFCAKAVDRYFVKHFSKDRERARGMRKWDFTGKEWAGQIKVRHVVKGGSYAEWRAAQGLAGCRLTFKDECLLWRSWVFPEERTRAQRAAAQRGAPW